MLKITSCVLDKVCGLNSRIPRHMFDEYVLCGRSNVGKSSFINTICNRKNYAHTSKTPGKTRTINYYLINDKFYLVDLPGYGFAKASAKEQNDWATFINEYFKKSESIEEIIMLVDIRHEPTKDDKSMFEWILTTTGFEPIVIATKSDKIKKTEIKKSIDVIRKAFNGSDELIIIPFSSETKDGLDTAMKYLFEK